MKTFSVDARLRKGAGKGNVYAVASMMALTLTWGAGAQEVADVPRLSLEEAIERALSFSPQMAQSRQQVVNAEESVRTSWGSFLPALSASAGSSLRSQDRFDPATDRVVSGSADSYNAGLSLRYDLYTGGRRFAEMDQARADVDEAEARSTDQRFSVILQTKNVFFQVLRQDELAAVARTRVEQAEESLEMTRQQAQVGSATSSDTLRARLELINARQSVLETESGLRNARTALGRQVGLVGPVDAAQPEGMEPAGLPLSNEEILELAESSAPAVLAATAGAGAADAAVSAARTQYLPNLSLSSGYDWSNQAASFTDGTTGWSVRASLSYPLFNGFQRESQVARARAGRDVARRQEEDARLGARQEADAALQNLRTAEQAVDIANQAMEVAQEDLRVVRERYQVGVARIFDVIVSQVALDQARVDLVQARYDYLLTLAELEAIVGREL